MNKSDCLLSGGEWDPTDEEYVKNEKEDLTDSCPPELKFISSAGDIYSQLLVNSNLSDDQLKEFNTCKDGIGFKPKCVKVKAIDDVINSFYKNILGKRENIPSSNKVFNTIAIGIWITTTFLALLLYVFAYKKNKITKMKFFIILIFQLFIFIIRMVEPLKDDLLMFDGITNSSITAGISFFLFIFLLMLSYGLISLIFRFIGGGTTENMVDDITLL